MTEKDKQDCLQGVQEYIKQNTNSKDKEALMQAIEKVLQQNYIFDSDVLEVLDYIGVNIWGIYHKGYMDFKGKWHDDYYELELGIWERGSLCCGMIKDAIRLLKKKYTYMQSRNVGGSSSACGASPECVCPADSDVSSVCVVSPENGKVQSKKPQQLELPQLTEKESFYFARAIEKGLMIQNDKGYKWLHKGGKKSSLMYFISRIHNDLTEDSIPYKKIERLFNYKRLDAVYSSFMRTKQMQKWKIDIDVLF